MVLLGNLTILGNCITSVLLCDVVVLEIDKGGHSLLCVCARVWSKCSTMALTCWHFALFVYPIEEHCCRKLPLYSVSTLNYYSVCQLCLIYTFSLSPSPLPPSPCHLACQGCSVRDNILWTHILCHIPPGDSGAVLPSTAERGETGRKEGCLVPVVPEASIVHGQSCTVSHQALH